MQFHLCHVVPDARMHGLYGYQEVIDTVRWGLAEIGHDTTASLNQIDADKTNIVFGGQVMLPADLPRLPKGTIFYNFEQIALQSVATLKPILPQIAQQFQIWDYNLQNIDVWNQMNPAHQPVLVPVGWAPVLEKIPSPEKEDIDALLYGVPSDERGTVFTRLCNAGLKCVFVCGLYGSARNDLIARSKIVLNINLRGCAGFFLARQQRGGGGGSSSAIAGGTGSAGSGSMDRSRRYPANLFEPD